MADVWSNDPDRTTRRETPRQEWALNVGTRVEASRFELIDNCSVETREQAVIVGNAGLAYLVRFSDGKEAGAFPSEIKVV